MFHIEMIPFLKYNGISSPGYHQLRPNGLRLLSIEVLGWRSDQHRTGTFSLFWFMDPLFSGKIELKYCKRFLRATEFYLSICRGFDMLFLILSANNLRGMEKIAITRMTVACHWFYWFDMDRRTSAYLLMELVSGLLFCRGIWGRVSRCPYYLRRVLGTLEYHWGSGRNRLDINTFFDSS